MKNEKIALLGFGDIASRLVPHLKEAELTGVKRSPLSTPDVDIQTADCRDQASMDTLMAQGFDVIVMTFTPMGMSDEGYQAGYVDTVKTVLAALDKQEKSPRLIVFVSSTSVYGQHDASWINEDSPAAAKSYSGQRLLEAEQLLAHSAYTHCNVRFSGIYGPGRRRLIEQVIAGKGSPAKPILYSNRIHSEDCAAVLAHLINQQKHQTIEPLYIATDCEPVPLYEVKHFIAKTLGYDNTHLKESNEQSTRMPRSSKRCSNKKLIDSGYQFLYPSYKEGYLSLLE